MTRVRQIVVINLDRDTGRLAHISSQLAAHNLEFTRFPAIDGRRLPGHLASYFDKLVLDEARLALLSAGEIGCYASHLEICRLAAEGQLETPLLVLEDDVELPPHFPYVLSALASALPAAWDFVRLSNDTKRSFLPITSVGAGFHLVRYSKIPGSTGATLISRSGAQKFLKRAVRNLPVDQDLKRAWAWNLETYGVLPAPVRRDTLKDSTIDAMASPQWRKTQWRIAAMRAQRILETLPRHLNGAKTFGVRRWLHAEAINLIVGSIGKQRREDFLARASHRLSTKADERPARASSVNVPV